MLVPFSLSLTGVSYGMLLVFVLLALLAVVFIPCLLVSGARPFSVGKSVYCMMMQLFGILLMAAGGLPAVQGVMEKFVLHKDNMSTEMYIAFLLLFAVGGIVFLVHEQRFLTIDEASRRVAGVLFWFTIKITGFLMTALAFLSVLLTLLLAPQAAPGWWLLPTLLFLFGLLLSWCTRHPHISAAKTFEATPVLSGHPSVEKKAAVKKKK